MKILIPERILYTYAKIVITINHENQLVVMDLKRTASVSLLAFILLGLCLYYHNYYDDNLKYPSTEAIESHYPEGSLVYITGSVTKPTKNGFNLRDGNNLDIVYNVTSNKKVQPIDYIQLLGILGHNYTINSTEIYAETNQGYEFIIFRSALALIVFILIFLWYWKFDFKRIEFIRRQ
ncbi:MULTISPECIES: hypothetical protein [Methanobacterium]|uniref:Uncharacterized protein n=1 Tax=Methanobacterium bryantii TaxID=2161 RepID=A0A2A2H3S4_METBR|nr:MULTISPECIES: hypothetical protein [Methanobacterium]OEC86069.1 hypothetical protein A9507_11480 [Methanobacterium sp. A39]PAV03940.1 hypothetical protein ASJ80_02685 [Methanobacterium bryantii]